MVERRGRQDLQVVGFVPGEGRPPPHSDLTHEEQDIWVETVEAMPAGWFTPETHQMLRAYCTHCVLVERLSKQALQPRLLPADLANLSKLLILETGQALRLARAMRLAPSTRLHKDTAAAKVQNQSRGRPWSVSA